MTKRVYPNFIEEFINTKLKLDPMDAFTIGKMFESFVCCNNREMQKRFIKYGLKNLNYQSWVI